MKMSRQLQQMQQILALQDTEVAIDLLYRYPALVQEHGKNARGQFVTVLSLAMDVGNSAVANRAIANGARLDLPIGPPPKGAEGHTALTYAFSEEFAAREESRAVVAAMTMHAMYEQDNPLSVPPSVALLGNLKASAGAAWKKIVAEAGSYLSSDIHLKSSAVLHPVGIAFLGIAAHTGMLDQPVAIAAMAGVAAVSATMSTTGIVLRNLKEQSSQTGLDLAVRHGQAQLHLDSLVDKLRAELADEQRYDEDDSDAPAPA